MKKWYRIGICLALIVFLLLLTACKGNPIPPANDPTLSSGKESTDTTDNTENNTQTNETDDPAQGNSSQSTAIKITFKDSFVKLEKWESVSLFKGTQLTYETCNTYADGILEHHSVSYRPDYFNDRSLILVELTPDKLFGENIWEVTDVSYESGVVVCHLKVIGLNRSEDLLRIPVSNPNPLPDFWACFIEIDFVIPDGAEIKVEFEDLFLDYEEYSQKNSEFKAKGI